MIRALLFDIGGTLLDDSAPTAALMEEQKRVLREAGYPVTDEAFAQACQEALRAFVPGLQRAVVWRFTQPNKDKCNALLAQARAEVPDIIAKFPRTPLPGIEPVLAELADRYTLALAGNAPGNIRDDLQRLGLLKYFRHTDVSEDLGVSKPDPQFFLTIIERAGMAPHEALMIGDRLDNDLIPARKLGMKTLWLRQGDYAVLEPRTPEEEPDVTVTSVQEIPEAIAHL